jgi:hypothetical protein
MKQLILLCLTSVFLFSCSKNSDNIIDKEKSVTYLLHHYEGNKFLYTDTSVHWCKVKGEDLERFESKPTVEESFCGTDNKLQLVIGDACKNHLTNSFH